MSRLSSWRASGLLLLASVFFPCMLLLRVALLLRSLPQVDTRLLPLLWLFVTGELWDLVTFFYCVWPAALFASLLPEKVLGRRLFRWTVGLLFSLAVFLILFGAACEWFFWDEFGSRFNFVAVDYLVYTTEVVGNIWESYPVARIIAVLLALTVAIIALLRRRLSASLRPESFSRERRALSAVFLAVPLLPLLFVDVTTGELGINRFNDELARNGIYTLFAAFRGNVLDYDGLYVARDPQASLARLRGLLQRGEPGAVFSGDGIRRRVVHPGRERRCNVVIVMIESLSAEFMGAFGDGRGLTPRLDALAKEGLFFRSFYATGTRTDRGLEAVTLSLPPTPGRSLVKRPQNGGLFSIGPLFAGRGYEPKFIYGGFGYFDNMNAFFEGNGFRAVDRRDLGRGEITFSNVWGVCDGDLFRRALKEMDASHARGKPFLSLLMTTSNHRPFTYPRVTDMGTLQGRDATVRYTDFAVGQFLDEARRRPWFDDTIFVILADHHADSAGKAELSVEKYHIPLIVYAPKLVSPRTVDVRSGQIDLAPTLLGLLNWSYDSKFFGRDVLAGTPRDGDVFIGNYQKVAMLRGDRLEMLLPKKIARTYRVEGGDRLVLSPPDEELLDDTVAYYQSAAYLLKRRQYTAP